MKLILCTLAVCLSLLASVVSIQVVVREEGRRTRAALSKSSAEPSGAADGSVTLPQKLDILNAQLSNLNRRIGILEDSVTSSLSSQDNQAAQSRLLELTKELNGINAALVKLDGVPEHLAELTTFVDQSFEHLENTTTAAANTVPETLATALGGMSQKIDAIDSYFTPLYAFLGLPYDPDNNDLLATYPSIDERINMLYQQQETMQQDVSSLRTWLTPPHLQPRR